MHSRFFAQKPKKSIEKEKSGKTKKNPFLFRYLGNYGYFCHDMRR